MYSLFYGAIAPRPRRILEAVDLIVRFQAQRSTFKLYPAYSLKTHQFDKLWEALGFESIIGETPSCTCTRLAQKFCTLQYQSHAITDSARSFRGTSVANLDPTNTAIYTPRNRWDCALLRDNRICFLSLIHPYPPVSVPMVKSAARTSTS